MNDEPPRVACMHRPEDFTEHPECDGCRAWLRLYGTLPLLDRPSTPEDFEAEREAPRSGLWAGEPGADLRRLTQDQTDALIRYELYRYAYVGELADIVSACGGQPGMLLLEGVPEGAIQRAAIQRGGIDSDPLVRILARRAWGDRDRQWFDLRGVRKGDRLIFDRLDQVASDLWGVRNGWHAGAVARHDARPGESVAIHYPDATDPEDPVGLGPPRPSALVSDRLRDQELQIGHYESVTFYTNEHDGRMRDRFRLEDAQIHRVQEPREFKQPPRFIPPWAREKRGRAGRPGR